MASPPDDNKESWKAIYSFLVAAIFSAGLVVSVVYTVSEANVELLEITNSPVPVRQVGDAILADIEFVERGVGPYHFASAMICDDLLIPLPEQDLPALTNVHPERVDLLLIDQRTDLARGEHCYAVITVQSDGEIIENFITEDFIIR